MFRIDPHAQAHPRPQPAPSAFPKTKRIIPPARYANAHAEAMRRIQEDALRAAREQSTEPSPPSSDAASSDSDSESDTDSEEEDEARETSFIKPAYVSLFFGWFGATAKQPIPPDLRFHFPDEDDTSKLPQSPETLWKRVQAAADNRPATQTHTARKSFPLTPDPEPARVGRSARPPIPDFNAAPPPPTVAHDASGSAPRQAAPRPPPPRGKRLYKTTSLSRDEMKEQLFRERSERNRRIQAAQREEARREEAFLRAEREEEARQDAEAARCQRAAQEERRRLAAEIAQRQREVEAELRRQRAAAAERDAETRRRQAEAEEDERQRRAENERERRRRLEEQMRDLREKVERSKSERARQEEQAGTGRMPPRWEDHPPQPPPRPRERAAPDPGARARAEQDAARAHDEARRRAQRLRREESAFKRMAGRWDARERHRSSSSPTPLKRTPTLTPRERYEVLWTRLLSPPTPETRPFTFTSFPWPGGRTVVEIAKFLLGGPGVEGGKERYVIRQQLKRWHPDKFATAVMAQGRVVEADRERVLEGQKAVVLALNELLARF